MIQKYSKSICSEFKYAIRKLILIIILVAIIIDSTRSHFFFSISVIPSICISRVKINVVITYMCVGKEKPMKVLNWMKWRKKKNNWRTSRCCCWSKGKFKELTTSSNDYDLLYALCWFFGRFVRSMVITLWPFNR